MAYIGLEVAMSFVKLNKVKDYWADKMFIQQKDFQGVMSRNLFQDICGSVMLHDPGMYDHAVASADPLHHSRNLLGHFLRNSAKVAVPVGTSALDENSARTKATCPAVTFNAEKPDKFAIRFYCVVSTAHTYVHSMMDNRSGNKTQQTAPEAYCQLFSELCTPYNNCIANSSNLEVKADSASAGWVLQMVHQTKTYQDPNHKRVIFCDNFYTRHTLASSLKKITDGEARLIGTSRFNNVDATNRFYLKQAIEELENKPRGSWVLVRAYDKVENYDALKRQHTNQQNHLPRSQWTPFVPPMTNVSEKAGYDELKDAKVVTYSDYACITDGKS
jgi:hypothetical protein